MFPNLLNELFDGGKLAGQSDANEDRDNQGNKELQDEQDRDNESGCC